MKTFQKVLIAMLLCVIWNATTAQENYKTGIGVRLGGLTSGVTVKSFVNPSSAVEGIVSFGRATTVITGLYEKHIPIVNAEGLNWFYGGGAHLGFFRYTDRYYYYWAYDRNGRVYYVSEPGGTAVVPGLDFIIGLDYKFRNAPFNAALDLKPFVDIFDGVNGYFDGALSFRFTF